MMLIDLHAHTSGISTCCRAPALDVLLQAKRKGIDGIVLTNHYKSRYLTDKRLNCPTPEALAAAYVAEYEYTKTLGEKLGLRVYFGIEVLTEGADNVDMMIYGVEPEFILQHPEIYTYTQEKFTACVHEAGGFVVQPHSLRNGENTLIDLRYLDGIELNSHCMYDGTHKDELIPLALANGKFLTSGGDYHADKLRPKCGTYVPETVQNTRDIMQYLAAEKHPSFLVQESELSHPEKITVDR